MILKEIIDNIKYKNIHGNMDVEVKELTRDSREVTPGYMYFAIVGERIDGHGFINDVISKGASVIIHSENINEYADGVTYVKVEDTRKAMAEISKIYFCNNVSIKVIGVTGTNGKTTSTSMLKHVLETNGKKVGLIGTIANYIGDMLIPTERTTPDSIELFRLIRDMDRAGCEYCIMEVSSHASALNRIDGIEFMTGMFTNLTQDHLDFHRTFEEYYKAKFDFINVVNTAVVNSDDNYGKKMIEDLKSQGKSCITYGLSESEFRAADVIQDSKKSMFRLYIKDKFVGKVSLAIPGLYNISNALGVIAILVGNGIMSIDDVIEGIKSLKNVAGRCEQVYNSKIKATVIVDYAHTPDGLENILKTMKDVCKGRLITVFGCGGNRDAGKRPVMGQISSKYSDFTIVTTDNPRNEQPQDIMDDILAGVSGEFIGIEDRKEAIYYALDMSEKDDIIVIAGKGHETYQIIGDKKIHFSDKEEVLGYK